MLGGDAECIWRSCLYIIICIPDLYYNSESFPLCWPVQYQRSVCFVGKRINKSRPSTQKLLFLDITCYCYIMLLKAMQGRHVVYCALTRPMSDQWPMSPCESAKKEKEKGGWSSDRAADSRENERLNGVIKMQLTI